MTETIRRELPAMTERIARLPVHRGYPVPWFVAWIDEAGSPVARGEGEPDFRAGLPSLRELAEQEGPEAVADLDQRVRQVLEELAP